MKRVDQSTPWPGLRRPARVLLLLCAAAALVIATHPSPVGAADRETLEALAAGHYDQEFRDHAARYHRVREAVFFAQVGVVILSVWLLATRAPRSWREGAMARVGGRSWLARIILLSGVHFGFALLRFPFSVFRYLHSRQVELRHDPWPSFLLDWLKAVGIGWILVVIVGLLILGLFAALPRWWWALTSLATAVLVLGYLLVAPLIIDPLFNQFRKLEDPVLEARLLALCRVGGVPAKEIWIADASKRTRAANAYITGIGNSRRIVLYDTLVQNFDADEVALILAHEVGHWRRRHIPFGIVCGLFGATLGFLVAHRVMGRWVARGWRGLSGRGDPALVFPAYALYLSLMLVALVPSNWVSRQLEADADRESLKLTQDPETFIRTEIRLAKKNLSDVLPPSWIEFALYTHPANIRRIHMAEEYR